MMGQRTGPAAAASLAIDRLDDVDVGQVHAAGGIGVVEDENVARRDAAFETTHEAGHRIVEGAKMHGCGQPLRQGLAAMIEDSGREIHRVAHDSGIGGAHEVERHVVGDGVEAALQNFQQEGINSAAHGINRHSPAERSIKILPWASRAAVASGGTTTVPSYSSMISGPPRGVSLRPPLDMTGVANTPQVGPKYAMRSLSMHDVLESREDI